mmetsp:Transcript_11679/g.21379  ORF Transcript_11679/g.21379 Transcript_11679/m.21379 type:complete len:91 (-) Transcript_11679:193-465(-)
MTVNTDLHWHLLIPLTRRHDSFASAKHPSCISHHFQLCTAIPFSGMYCHFPFRASALQSCKVWLFVEDMRAKPVMQAWEAISCHLPLLPS